MDDKDKGRLINLKYTKKSVRCLFVPAILVLAAQWGAPTVLHASPALSIYTDSFQPGWNNWSWAKVNLLNTSPVHSGKDSVSVTAKAWQALYVNHNPMNTSPYKELSFWLYGTVSGGSKVQAIGLLGKTLQKHSVSLLAPQGKWQHFTVLLSDLGVSGKPNFTGFWIQESSGKGGHFFVDDVSID